jgi:hypothetical protein
MTSGQLTVCAWKNALSAVKLLKQSMNGMAVSVSNVVKTGTISK